MEKMLHIFTNVVIKPNGHSETFLLATYYTEVNDFTRLVYDSKNAV